MPAYLVAVVSARLDASNAVIGDGVAGQLPSAGPRGVRRIGMTPATIGLATPLEGRRAPCWRC